METLLWYLEITLDYIKQMLPCMVIGAVCYLILLPHRRKELCCRGLKSGPVREAGLFVFVLFCAGLTALTVFPSGFWTAAHWQEVHRLDALLSGQLSDYGQLELLYGGGQRPHLRAGGLLSQSVVAEAQVVEGIGHWLLCLFPG